MAEDLPSFKSPVEVLCDDTLALVLSFADVVSSVRFSVCSKVIRDRIYPSTGTHDLPGDATGTEGDAKDPKSVCDHCNLDTMHSSVNNSNATFERLWRDVYFRHNFSPPDEPANNNTVRGTPLADNGTRCSKVNYLSECYKRRALFKNLFGRRKSKRAISCFSLPNRYFHFLPIVPTDRNNIEEWIDDPPPVEFSCESYALTSPGTSGEIVLMDPFDGSISVYDSVLDNAVASDEAMIVKAMIDATSAIISRREANENSEEENSISSLDDAGEAIDERVYRNHNIAEFRTLPSQVLFGVEDYFDVDLSAYFAPIRSNWNQEGLNANYDQVLDDDDDEIVIDWLGIDTHTIIDDDNFISGTLIGAARILISDTDPLEMEKTCVEILGWRRKSEDIELGKGYDDKFICRLHGAPYYLDVCARHKKIYACYPKGDSPFESGTGNEEEESTMSDRESQSVHYEDDFGDDTTADWNGLPINQTNTIVRYPFLSVTGGTAEQNEDVRTAVSYFPSPESCFKCKHPVSCFSVDPSGNRLAAGTIKGTVEIWDVSVNSYKPVRLQTLDIEKAFSDMGRSISSTGREDFDTVESSDFTENVYHSDDTPSSLLATSASFPSLHQMTQHNYLGVNTNCRQEEGNERESSEGADENQRIFLDYLPADFVERDSSVVDETNDDLSTPSERGGNESHTSVIPLHPNSSGKVENIYIPRHCPIGQCGLVTSQHNREHGTVLLLWQNQFLNERSNVSSSSDLQLSAIINVPLSAQHKPQVSFDGRRLVVFGQDHIGLIILIYHVLSTREDQDSFATTKSFSAQKGSHGDDSGGVTNLGVEQRVKFVNRIRQVGLGGLEYYDSMFMTCNERFIVVNTKTGNLVGGSCHCAATEGLFIIDLEEHA